VDFPQAAAIREMLALGGTEFTIVVIVSADSLQLVSRPIDLKAEFGPVLDVSCSFRRDVAGYWRLLSSEVESMALNRLDLLLDFTGKPLAGDILDVPVHGVWSFLHREDRQRSISIVTLAKLCNPFGSAIPLASCTLHADPESAQNRHRAAMLAAAYLPAQICKALRNGRPDCLTAAARPDLLVPSRKSRWKQVFDILELGLTWGRAQLASLLFMETWNIGIVQAPIHRFLEPGFRPDINWAPPIGPRKFLADPFAVPTEKGVELFVEEFDYDRYQGYICSAEWLPGQQPEWKTRIDKGIHMSYPYPIQHAGKRYVTPESSLNREVALYECKSTAGAWPKVTTLIENFAAVDPTLIEYEGRWWLFCTCRDDFPDSKLYLWHAPELSGPWEPHRMNPVKFDVRSSRPAGTPFWHNGSLYRPAQDSSKTYGGAIIINRITKLTLDEFEEEPAIHLEPFRHTPYHDGWHTLSAAGPITVLDGKRMGFIPRLSARRLRHKVGRLSGLLFRQGGIR